MFPLDVGVGDDDSHAHCGSGFGSGVVDLVLVPFPYLYYALFSAQPLSQSLAPLPELYALKVKRNNPWRTTMQEPNKRVFGSYLLSLPALAHAYPTPQNTLQTVSHSAARMSWHHLLHVLLLHHVLSFLALDPVLVHSSVLSKKKQKHKPSRTRIISTDPN